MKAELERPRLQVAKAEESVRADELLADLIDLDLRLAAALLCLRWAEQIADDTAQQAPDHRRQSGSGT
jgi:hypothetical protein